MSKKENSADDFDHIFAKELERPVGKELAGRIEKEIPGVTADMARSEAIALAATVRALKGDNTAVKYLFEAARRREARQEEIPFVVEYEVVDEV